MVLDFFSSFVLFSLELMNIVIQKKWVQVRENEDIVADITVL